jgi:hypothetical protein
MLTKIRNLIPAQKRTSPILGGVKSVISNTLFYATILSFILNITVAYDISIHPRFPWLPFWIYITTLITLGSLAIAFEYTRMMPSCTEFANDQAVKFPNPIKKDLEKIKKHLGIKEE